MADINLTASMRTNLLSLQNTEDLMDMTSERLSTGLKVNSALDNPSSFYTAQGLSNRANDLSALMDSMGQGISTLKATDEGLTSITAFVEQIDAIVGTTAELVPDAEAALTANVTLATATADEDITMEIDGREFTVAIENGDTAADIADKLQDTLGDAFSVADDGAITYNGSSSVEVEITGGAAVSALNGGAVGDPFAFKSEQTGRADALGRVNDILIQIDNMAGDASYKGVNLLDGKGNDLTVYFNEDRSSALKIDNVDATSQGLGLNGIDTLATNEDVNAALTTVDKAIDTLRNMANDFGNQYAIVQNWEDFTDNMINTLTEGADKLTLADMNEEGANMLALQTRQQLATNSLSMSSQAAQAVLRLF